MRKLLAILVLLGITAACRDAAFASGAGAPAITGFAILIDPTTHAYVATFVEQCAIRPARVAVYLAQPYTLKETEYLGIDPEGTSTLSTSLYARGNSISMTTIGGTSKTGCLPVGTRLALVSSPGGPLGGLLLVLAEGMVMPAN